MEFSELIINKLRAIDSKIAKTILENYEDLSGTFDYVNVGSRKDLVSFLPANKDSDDEWTDFRNEIKIGRFVRQIIGFINDELDEDINIKDKELEDFVNKYKVASSGDNYKFKIVEGEELRAWYLGDDYAEGDGSLNDSCMRGEEENEFLTIYAKNKSKIKLLILKDRKSDELLGRALLWELDKSPSPTKTFMDRIYVSEEYLFELFRQKAEVEGWMYKSAQSNDLERGQEFLHLGKKYRGKIKIKLDRFTFDTYPYLDSLPFFNKDTGTLQNRGFKNALVLRSVEGDGNDKCCCCGGSFVFECNYCSEGNRSGCPHCNGTGEQNCGECNFN